MVECFSHEQLGYFLSLLNMPIDYYHQVVIVHAEKATVIYEQVAENTWCIAKGLKS